MDTKVLVVDDDPSMLRLLEKRLTDDGHEVLLADNGPEALRLLVSQGPRIVITDWMMPEMDGLDLCRAIRSSKNIGFAYIVVLTAHTDKGRLVEAFEAGADDFLSKPFHREELRARLNAGIRITGMQENLTQNNQALHGANAQLAVLNRKLEHMATTDALTGLANRRWAMARLAEYWAMTGRSDQPLACMSLDIDHFKDVNDTYGHEAGDAVLRETAEVLARLTRGAETPCRVGGEEFLILCPNDTAQAAAVGAERLRQGIESNRIRYNDLDLAVTVSAGVVQRGETTGTQADLLKHADEAMYAAKRAGRNRVCVAGDNGPVLFPKGCPEEADADCSRTPPVARSPGSSYAVMVVDDDASSRALCRKVLEQVGYRVVEAVDGCDALAKIGRGTTDAVIMDAMMPNMDGLECTRRLKADPATRDVPIIMASARSRPTDVVAGLEAGADEYIAKPIRPRELVLRVQSVASHHHRNLQLLHANELRSEQARSLGLLVELSRSLVAAQELSTVLTKTVSTAAKLTRSGRVSIMLPDRENRFLTIAKAIGIDEGVASRVRVPIGCAIAGRVFRSGEPVVLNSPEETSDRDFRYDSSFFVSVPLVSKALYSSGRVVGVLSITERKDNRPFQDSELEYIDLMSNIAASVIDDIFTRRARDAAQDSIVAALAQLAEYRDKGTGKHLERVTKYSLILAAHLRETDQFRADIDDTFMHDFERAVPLHDIGKVTIPDYILLKPGSLTAQEKTQMQGHAEAGAEVLRSISTRVPAVDFVTLAEEIAWGHHEWYDGGGYPRGIGGRDIPLPARIVAVADVYDALTSKRVYKDAITHGEALELLRQGSGSQFDPAVIDAFLECEEECARVAAALSDVHPKGQAPQLVVAEQPA